MSSLPTPSLLPIRIGQGFDIHPLTEGRPLILGGLPIPHTHGLSGHSDGDALCHAITDALLGAVGLGDIGRHFPDNEPAYKNADSAKLLSTIMQKVRDRGFAVINVDATIITERPKLSPYINPMAEGLAKILAVSPTQINIKAKTHEKMDAIGKGEALSVHTVVLLQKMD